MGKTYTSDRGDKYEISKMDDSHLINVIAHHQKQLETLNNLPVNNAYIAGRKTLLGKTVFVLSQELATRPVNPNQYITSRESNDE